VSRVLIDTNVYISALVFGGTPAAVFELIDALGIEIVTSAELESELMETLTRKFGWSRERVHEAGDRLLRDAYRADPSPLARVVRDSGDDHVIAAAIAADAEFIVTGDNDLLSLGTFGGIRIIRPSAFVELLAAGDK
jgi:putative PIN family toxin of toxin-antitoxin system